MLIKNFEILRIPERYQDPVFSPLRGTNSKAMQNQNSVIIFRVNTHKGGRHGDLMAGALDSGASGLGSSPGRGHCIVFLGKTLYSHGASLHPGV